MLFSFMKVSLWYQYKAAGIWGVKSSSSNLELTQLAKRSSRLSSTSCTQELQLLQIFPKSVLMNRWKNEVPGYQTECSFLVITLAEYQDLWQVALSPWPHSKETQYQPKQPLVALWGCQLPVFLLWLRNCSNGQYYVWLRV